MMVVTSRAEFEKLVEVRMRQARLLINANDWDGAYYLAGYAVEFALKVLIIAEVMKSDGFPGKKQAENFYKHDLTILRKEAGLAEAMNRDPAVSDL